ncbi:hypothetical protein JCM19238_4675 [Vibrio ponticus]|nr:hypothetical protein JCM19238_4675 [Vibrio ponticus]
MFCTCGAGVPGPLVGAGGAGAGVGAGFAGALFVELLLVVLAAEGLAEPLPP